MKTFEEYHKELDVIEETPVDIDPQESAKGKTIVVKIDGKEAFKMLPTSTVAQLVQRIKKISTFSEVRGMPASIKSVEKLSKIAKMNVIEFKIVVDEQKNEVLEYRPIKTN